MNHGVYSVSHSFFCVEKVMTQCIVFFYSSSEVISMSFLDLVRTRWIFKKQFLIYLNLKEDVLSFRHDFMQKK